MAEEIENRTEMVDVPTDKSLVYTVKVVKKTENVTEKPCSGCRGKDKRPRTIRVNSIHNLRPFQSILDTSVLRQYARDPYRKPSLSSTFWLVFFIVLGIIAVYIIWTYYKEKREQAYNSGNVSNIFDTVK